MFGTLLHGSVSRQWLSNKCLLQVMYVHNFFRSQTFTMDGVLCKLYCVSDRSNEQQAVLSEALMNVANGVRVGAALWRSWPECMQGLSSRRSLPLCLEKLWDLWMQPFLLSEGQP